MASGLGMAEHAEERERHHRGNGVVEELNSRMASAVVREN